MKINNKIFLTSLFFSTFQLNAAGFTMNVDSAIEHDDNIYKTSDLVKEADTLISLSPNINFGSDFGKQKINLSYKGNYAKHFQLDEADYDDHILIGKIDFSHSNKFGTGITATYRRDHQEPGTINRIQLEISEYNLFEEKKYGISSYYGTNESIGRIEFDYNFRRTNFINNELEFLDNRNNTYKLKFIYKTSDKTRAYVAAILSDFDYSPPLESIDQDNENNIYRIGIKWDFTGKLTGDVNIGYQERKYKNQLTRNTSGLNYEGSIHWYITERTDFEFASSREALDSTIDQIGSFTRTTYKMSLDHSLTERLNTSITLNYFKDELNLLNNRDDNRFLYELEISYEVTRNIDIGMDYRLQKRNSTLEIAEYESNLFGINVQIAME